VAPLCRVLTAVTSGVVTSDPTEAVAAAVHDVRGSVGSIRLALTSVLEEIDDPDVEFRRSMLAGAEAECRRLNASLTALPALVAAGVDSSQPAAADLVACLEAAREDAARRQVDVVVDASGPVQASVRSASITEALAALCVVVADGDGAVVVGAREEGGHAVVTVARADGSAVRWDRAVIRGLAESLGAEVAGGANGFGVIFPTT